MRHGENTGPQPRTRVRRAGMSRPLFYSPLSPEHPPPPGPGLSPHRSRPSLSRTLRLASTAAASTEACAFSRRWLNAA